MKKGTPKSIVVIGAGVSGLAAAIRLRLQGHQVTLIEKNNSHGGKLSEFSESGFRFDKGPSLFTEPELVDEIFALARKNPRDYFNYKEVPVSCSYYFSDKTHIQFNTNKQELKLELTNKLGTDYAYRTLTYLERSKETYDKIGSFFVDRAQVRLKDIFRKDLLIRYPHFLTGKLRKTLHQYNLSSLKNEKLIQIFDRYATYNGSNPYKMSGLYSMIPHLEQNSGTYFPVNGMRSIVDSLKQLAIEEGVNILYNQTSSEIVKKANRFEIHLADDVLTSDIVVCAIDHLTFYRDILKDETSFRRYYKQERSTSGIVFYWGVKRGISKLGLHSILFSNDYKKEFEQLFKDKIIPENPTIYIHISSSVNPSDAPNNGQNWFVMINTPSGYYPSEEDLKLLRHKIAERIKTLFDVSILDEIVCEKYWTAKNLEIETGALEGALYGAASNGKLAALKRHSNKVKKHPGIYFCGGTVHPGGGIPLVLKSARIVSDIIANER